MTGTVAEEREREWQRTPHEGEIWQLDMRDAESTTEEERRKDKRAFADTLVRFSAKVTSVEPVLGGSSTVELAVVRSNDARAAPSDDPDDPAIVEKFVETMVDRPEWSRVGG